MSEVEHRVTPDICRLLVTSAIGPTAVRGVAGQPPLGRLQPLTPRSSRRGISGWPTDDVSGRSLVFSASVRPISRPWQAST